MKDNENNLHLADLIQRVKQELINSSKQSLEDQEQDGTPILLELDEVELELKFYVSTSGKGKANIFVSSVEGSVESTKEQIARIKLKVHKGFGENKHGDNNIYHHKETNDRVSGLEIGTCHAMGQTKTPADNGDF